MAVDLENVTLIRFTPIAFESLGVRSMCTYVETPDVKILIDPGVALGPRFRLLPHPREYEALKDSRERIRRYAKIADIMVVSHYHHDHFTPNFTDTTWLASSAREAGGIYRGKTIMVKDARSSMNVSQRRRGWIFQSFCRKIGCETIIADGRRFEYGDTRVRFSVPLPHGENVGDLGSVVATVVELHSERFIHASDIQGPMSDSALQFILDEAPSTVIIGGPPTYLSGVRVSAESVTRAMENLEIIARRTPLVIVDHHLLRAQDSIRELSAMSATLRSVGGSIMTAAEHIQEQPQLLEANRMTLYREEPPSRHFIKWTKLRKEKQSQTGPPLERKRRKKGGVSESH
ncbi:MBL fold metallo-hydrolase [[Eubacterium] cellulosolvens]